MEALPRNDGACLPGRYMVGGDQDDSSPQNSNPVHVVDAPCPPSRPSLLRSAECLAPERRQSRTCVLRSRHPCVQTPQAFPKTRAPDEPALLARLGIRPFGVVADPGASAAQVPQPELFIARNDPELTVSDEHRHRRVVRQRRDTLRSHPAECGAVRAPGRAFRPSDDGSVRVGRVSRQVSAVRPDDLSVPTHPDA